MSLRYNHAKIQLKSRNVEQLQRFSRKSEKIQANFMEISENHDEIRKKSNFSACFFLVFLLFFSFSFFFFDIAAPRQRRLARRVELFSMSNFENAKKIDENLLKY